MLGFARCFAFPPLLIMSDCIAFLPCIILTPQEIVLDEVGRSAVRLPIIETTAYEMPTENPVYTSYQPVFYSSKMLTYTKEPTSSFSYRYVIYRRRLAGGSSDYSGSQVRSASCR